MHGGTCARPPGELVFAGSLDVLFSCALRHLPGRNQRCRVLDCQRSSSCRLGGARLPEGAFRKTSLRIAAYSCQLARSRLGQVYRKGNLGSVRRSRALITAASRQRARNRERNAGGPDGLRSNAPARFGASADERRVVGRRLRRPRPGAGTLGRRRACASLVASFAAWVPWWNSGVLSAIFRRDVPAGCGAFADEQRVVGGRRRWPRADAKRTSNLGQFNSSSAMPTCHHSACIVPRRVAGRRRACASLVASFAADATVWDAGGRYGGWVMRSGLHASAAAGTPHFEASVA